MRDAPLSAVVRLSIIVAAFGALLNVGGEKIKLGKAQEMLKLETGKEKHNYLDDINCC